MESVQPESDLNLPSGIPGIRGQVHIDHLLRTVQQHHVQLSTMADQKANIIIAASSLLITLSLSRFQLNTLYWGLVVLSFFSLIAMIFAILAVTPSFRRSTKPVTDTTSLFNPLFFGHFTELSLDQYRHTMTTILSSESVMYDAVIRDIYQLGQVLKHRKYRYLRYSYLFFFIGLVSSGSLLVFQFAFEFM